uniref:Uncharacterized protein n=1 Tax=Opuntia streptacantha TaxID=393608 RepID=A0A7C9AWJ7_OPUST
MPQTQLNLTVTTLMHKKKQGRALSFPQNVRQDFDRTQVILSRGFYQSRQQNWWHQRFYQAFALSHGMEDSPCPNLLLRRRKVLLIPFLLISFQRVSRQHNSI